MKTILITLLLISTASFADNNCTRTAEDHKENNIGYEVGENCKVVRIIGAESTRLDFVDGANGECKQMIKNGLSVMIFSMDAAKEDTREGNGCQVRATYNDGRARIISIRAVEN